MLRTVLRVFVASIILALASTGLRAGEADKPAKILFFTKSARYEHSVIAQKDGKPSFAETILDELGAKNN